MVYPIIDLFNEIWRVELLTNRIDGFTSMRC